MSYNVVGIDKYKDSQSGRVISEFQTQQEAEDFINSRSWTGRTTPYVVESSQASSFITSKSYSKQKLTQEQEQQQYIKEKIRQKEATQLLELKTMTTSISGEVKSKTTQQVLYNKLSGSILPIEQPINIPVGNKSLQLQNLDLAISQGQLQPSQRESVRQQILYPEQYKPTRQKAIDIFNFASKQTTAEGILGGFRMLPSEYQTGENLGFIAQKSLFDSEPKPKGQLFNWDFGQPEYEFVGYKRPKNLQETIDVMPILPDIPTNQIETRERGILKPLTRTEIIKSYTFGLSERLEYKQQKASGINKQFLGVAVLGTSLGVGLIEGTTALFSPSFYKGTFQAITNPKETIDIMGTELKQRPISFIGEFIGFQKGFSFTTKTITKPFITPRIKNIEKDLLDSSETYDAEYIETLRERGKNEQKLILPGGFGGGAKTYPKGQFEGLSSISGKGGSGSLFKSYPLGRQELVLVEQEQIMASKSVQEIIFPSTSTLKGVARARQLSKVTGILNTKTASSFNFVETKTSQSSINTFASKQISSQISIPKQKSIISQKPIVTQKPRQIPIVTQLPKTSQKPKQKPIITQIPKVAQKPIVEQKPKQKPITIQKPIVTQTIKQKPVMPKLFKVIDLGKELKRNTRTSKAIFPKFKTRYTASIGAVLFNIRGARPKTITGLEVRKLPILRTRRAKIKKIRLGRRKKKKRRLF